MNLSFLILMMPFFIVAQAENIFNDIRLGDPINSSYQKLDEISETAAIITIDSPGFPLAKEREEHLVCTKIKTEHGFIERAVFIFADNALSYIAAKGNAVSTFTSKRQDTASTYLDYSIYANDKLFLNQKKDIAWVLNDEAIHVNLFSWDNPYLDPKYEQEQPNTPDRLIPAFIKMGASMEEIKPLIEANSRFISVEELDGNDPNAQVQINGFGIPCLGFPRKIEARFGDNKLNVVWILTGKGEEERIRKALIDQFGEAVYTNNEWEIYNDWQVGLRKDKPEVLLMEKQIGLAYKTSYFGQ